jgi:hypothetical protein
MIKEVKEAPVAEEVMPEDEVAPEVPVAAAEEVSAPKKTVESIVKETFFAEVEALKTENETLKAELSKLKEVKEIELTTEDESKPITHNPENVNETPLFKYGQNRPKSLMDSIIEKINK